MDGKIKEVKVAGVWCYVLAENDLGVTIADPQTGLIKAILWGNVEAIK